ncbi:protein Hook homolog 1 isoform X1 [Scyliorhinus canicula]|uniref:protein Hook homolog 1 isoform X1 n=1 Tax=Scyliorhinus canicula TaxID=7830 RepID=UPI0018F37648|nr:protein Hook homolog 1 isoform X1 [Scyliorhinus canicula]
MEVNKSDLCDSLIIWLQTFNVSSKCANVQDLISGAAMAQVLNQIDPSWFNELWLSRIKDDVGGNSRLKMSNLKKILPMVLDYYHEVLGQQIADSFHPDLNLIVEHVDIVELGRLLQLILGCAVNCEKKQEHIQNIMTLEESVQHNVMTAIQELMSKELAGTFGTEASGDLDLQLKKTLEDLNVALLQREELSLRCQELDIQVSTLHEEKNSLLAENDLMTERINQLDAFDDPQSLASKKLQLDQLQEENYRLEAAKDDYRVHCEELERQLIEIQHRNDELNSLAEENLALKDEIDVLRIYSDKVIKLEASVETYKKKLEDLNDLRRQVKLLEDKNVLHMQNTVSLEEELRKANAARAQLETYKRQVQELHNSLSEEVRRADKLAFELKQIEEKHETLLKEKERLIVERDTLKETNEELKCTQVQQDHLLQSGKFSLDSHDHLAAEILPVEYREKFIRLQHENKMLQLHHEGSENERILALQKLLDDANRTKNELETENRIKNQRVQELQHQVDDLQKVLQEQGSKSEESSDLKKKLDAHLEKLHEAHDELQKKREFIEDLQPEIQQSSQKIEELQRALTKKDEDMRAMEERYKTYLEKARNVIKALDPKQNPANAEIQMLKAQINEKDKKIQMLERECEQAKLRGYEEELIVTAWYNKTSNCGLLSEFGFSEDSHGRPIRRLWSKRKSVILSKTTTGNQFTENSHSCYTCSRPQIEQPMVVAINVYRWPF